MTTYRYGGFWRRGAAIIVDKIILYIICLVVIFIEFMILPVSPYASHPGAPSGILADMSAGFIIRHYIMAFLIAMVYFIHFHGSSGQTPGKMLMGIKVVQITGKSMTYGIAFLRWVGYIVSALPLYFGFIWAAFDRKKQGWHDKIAGTVVVHVTNNNEQKVQLNLWSQ